MMYCAPVVLTLGTALKVWYFQFGIGEGMVIHWINFDLIVEKGQQAQDDRTWLLGNRYLGEW
jgi:hypothetical protein